MSAHLQLLSRTLGEHAAELLLPHLDPVRVPSGTVLYRDGLSSGELHLLCEGTLRVAHEAEGRLVELGTIASGRWLGEVGFIDRGPATATIVAATDCELLRIDHERLLRLQVEEPAAVAGLLRYLTKELAERLARTSAGVVEELPGGRLAVNPVQPEVSWLARALGWLTGGAR